MKKIVVLQPMFFPWIGVFEQIRLADVYVHFDDVQYPHGRSFMNRIRIKTSMGTQWITVPISRTSMEGRPIKDVVIEDSQDWREKHLKALGHHYARAPYKDDMLDIVKSTYSLRTSRLSELNIYALEKITGYFGLKTRFLRSSDFAVTGKSSHRLLGLVSQLNGDVYITGHGAKNYLDHDLFERSHIRVEYMDYERTPYRQLFGPFDPHLSILDLIANLGREGIAIIHSNTAYWRDYLGRDREVKVPVGLTEE